MEPTTIIVPAGKKVSVEITPLDTPEPLLGRCAGVCGAEATPFVTTDLFSGFLRSSDSVSAAAPSQAELLALESALRAAALSQSDRYLLGLNAVPAIESPGGQLIPFPLPAAAIGGAGIYQMMRFPISRFNGIPLPIDSSIRFADPKAVKTATGWAAAWAGAKAGVAVGALAGVETGPGLVLTAIGGGIVGGAAGYFGGNWIADWLFE